MLNTPIPVKLDRERHVAWGNSAYYRLSLITLQPQRSYAFLVQMIWACLVPVDAIAFPTPEHLAQHMDPLKAEEHWGVVEQIQKQQPKQKESKEAEAKNAVGSTPSPSP